MEHISLLTEINQLYSTIEEKKIELKYRQVKFIHDNLRLILVHLKKWNQRQNLEHLTKMFHVYR